MLGYKGRRRASSPLSLWPQLPVWAEVPFLVLVAFGFAVLVRSFLLQAFFIPSGSMENTLLIKDRVLVNKVVYEIREPRRGEVVVFRGEESWATETPVSASENHFVVALKTVGSLVGLAEPAETDFIKRVIGVGGDVVACCDEGRVTVNGLPLSEPYVFDNNPVEQRSFGPVTVPPGRLFVMGDHRGRSADSRAYLGNSVYGTVPVANVIGKAFVTIWPISRWSSL